MTLPASPKVKEQWLSNWSSSHWFKHARSLCHSHSHLSSAMSWPNNPSPSDPARHSMGCQQCIKLRSGGRNEPNPSPSARQVITPPLAHCTYSEYQVDEAAPHNLKGLTRGGWIIEGYIISVYIYNRYLQNYTNIYSIHTAIHISPNVTIQSKWNQRVKLSAVFANLIWEFEPWKKHLAFHHQNSSRFPSNTVPKVNAPNQIMENHNWNLGWSKK